MADKITISLIPDYNEYFPEVKDYLENQGFGIREIDNKDIVEVKPLEAIKVKGKEIPVMVYEIISLKDKNLTLD